jgi:two-component system, chemotaxis family, CheB/CheR fusion protein
VKGPEWADPGRAPRGPILVAEDNVDFRRLITEHLRRRGWAVFEACDGTEAFCMLGLLAVNEEPEVSLVISDLRMPSGIGGLDLLLKMRVTWKSPIPFILMSGDVTETEICEARKKGAVIVTKPFDLAKLDEAIVTCLRAP